MYERKVGIKKCSALPAIVASEAGDVSGLKIESDNELYTK